jgi:hypothetical protein
MDYGIKQKSPDNKYQEIFLKCDTAISIGAQRSRN